MGLLILFLTGLVTDVLWVLAVRTSAVGLAGRAAVVNFLLGAVSYGSIWTFFQVSPVLGAITFGAGCATGTWVTLRMRRHV